MKMPPSGCLTSRFPAASRKCPLGPEGALPCSGDCVPTEQGGLLEPPFLLSFLSRRKAVNGETCEEVLLQAGLPEQPPLWGTGDWDSSPALGFQGLLGAGLQMQITLAITHRRTYF